MTAFAHLSSSELDKLTEAALTPRLGAEDQALLNMLLQGKQPIALNPLKLPARPRTEFSRHAKRRAEVRQAALALFAERGVAQTSLTRIAAKLERSAGALRALYPDKAALLAEILQAHLAALLEAVDTAAAPKESAPRTRLEAMAAACFKRLAEEGAAVQRIFASACALLDEAGKTAVQSKQEALEARFAEAITAAVAPLLPAVPGAFATMLARSMLAILESAALGSAAAGDDAEGGDSAAAAAQAAVAGILAMAAPGPEPGAEGPSPPTASGPEPPPAQPTPPGASPTPGPSPHAGAGPQAEGASAEQTLGDLGHVLALKFDNRKLIGGDRAAAIAPGNRPAAVRGTAGHFIDHRQSLLRIGDPNDNHAMMQKRDVERQNRAFLPAVLRGGRGEHAAEFANQLALCPKWPRLVEKVAHLRRHVSESGRRAENNGVVIRKFFDSSNRCRLIQLGARLSCDVRRHNFRYALNGNRGARNRPRPFRNCFRKLLHPPIHRVVKHQNFAHRQSLSNI